MLKIFLILTLSAVCTQAQTSHDSVDRLDSVALCASNQSALDAWLDVKKAVYVISSVEGTLTHYFVLPQSYDVVTYVLDCKPTIFVAKTEWWAVNDSSDDIAIYNLSVKYDYLGNRTDYEHTTQKRHYALVGASIGSALGMKVLELKKLHQIKLKTKRNVP